MTELSIIVPTYNECESLPILAERIHQALSDRDYQIVVVDDNSPDGTGEVAEKLALEKPLKVIHRTGKLGLASAVIEGFQQADGRILGVIDADLQHPPEKIADMLAQMDQSDVVIACRYMPGGGVEQWTFFREVISRVAKIMPQFLFARIRQVRDPLSGFFLFRKTVIEGIELKPIGYKILLEILVKGRYDRVHEVPYMFTGREHGQSTFNSAEQINYLKHLYRLSRSEKELSRFIKFCTVGLSGVVVNMGLFWLMTRFGGIRDIVALPIGIEVSILTNFILNDEWTFRDKRTTGLGTLTYRTLKFNLISLAGAGLNFGIFYLLTRNTGIFDLIALLIAIIAATLFNFKLNKWWTWR